MTKIRLTVEVAIENDAVQASALTIPENANPADIALMLGEGISLCNRGAVELTKHLGNDHPDFAAAFWHSFVSQSLKLATQQAAVIREEPGKKSDLVG